MQEEKKPAEKGGWIGCAVFVVALFFLVKMCTPSPAPLPPVAMSPPAAPMTAAQQDSADAAEIAGLESDLAEFAKTGCNASPAAAEACADNLGAFGRRVSSWAASGDAQKQAAAKRLRPKVQRLMSAQFPALRRAWAKGMGEKLWEDDVSVTVSGARADVVMFTGGRFAANANIKAAQETMSGALQTLRFRQARYRWSKIADEYTYFKMDAPADASLE